MDFSWNIDWLRGAEPGAVGWLVIAAIMAWLVVGEPVYGRHVFRKMLAALDAGIPQTRLAFYRSWIVQGWVLLAIVLILVFGVLGWTPERLGLRAPDAMPRPVMGMFAGAFAAAVGGLVIGMLAARRQSKPESAQPRRARAIRSESVRMLPRTRAERWGFAGLAITAGVTEEVIWRGFLLAAGAALLPQAPAWLLLVVASALFGLAHLYQGRAGVVVTAVIGFVLGGIYIGTGSLVLPVVLHVLLDLRQALLPAQASAG